MSKSKKRQHTDYLPSASELSPGAPCLGTWAVSGAILAAVVLAFFLYSPAINAPFLFDDISLPFYQPSFPHDSFSAWLSGVRPLLMLSYWGNFQVSGTNPGTYHAFNILLHAVNSTLVFVLFLRVLLLLGIERERSFWCAGIASCIYLVHPIQTEAVAYIAGRSELVCGFFVLAALTVFTRDRTGDITWARAGAVLLLYCCAILSKEHAVVLPAIFLAVDLVLRRLSLSEALRSGARLYGPIAAIGIAAIAGVAALLARSSTAGFNVPGMQWYEYLFTQFRVWILYLRLVVLPIPQNADYDIPLSHYLGEHGSALALLVLLAIGYLAWQMRSRFPLAFAGALIFAVLLAPTSSVVPIQDLAAERRLYLPLIGLLLVLMEALSRVKWGTSAVAATATYLLLCSALTFDRSKVWASDIALWSDTVAQSPEKARGYTHLTYAYVRNHRCEEAAETAHRVPTSVRDAPEFLNILGHAYACNQRMPEAIDAFERAVLTEPNVGSILALASTYRQAGRLWDAQAAEQQAMRLPPKTPYDFFMLDGLKTAREQGTRSRSAPSSRGGG